MGWEKKKRAEKKEEEKGESFSERDSTFSLSFPTIGRAFLGGARGRVRPQYRALHRDRSWGVSTNSER